MKMTIAQALKEKNRIVGEIANLWNQIEDENSCLETHTRSTDVKEAMQTVDHYIAKLVELKTKIGKANEGNLKNIYALEEAKSKKSHLENLNCDEDNEYRYSNGEKFCIERSAIFKQCQVNLMKKQLQRQCNELQDKLDTYNATTTIEFESPLK